MTLLFNIFHETQTSEHHQTKWYHLDLIEFRWNISFESETLPGKHLGKFFCFDFVCIMRWCVLHIEISTVCDIFSATNCHFSLLKPIDFILLISESLFAKPELVAFKISKSNNWPEPPVALTVTLRWYRYWLVYSVVYSLLFSVKKINFIGNPVWTGTAYGTLGTI